MQDRYVGDIGDFGKFALLKELNKQGLSIGINWYKTEVLPSEMKPDGSYKHNDGRHTIPDRLGECDRPLAENLSKIANNNRSILALEEADLIPNAVYYREPVPVADKRLDWHNQAMSFFETSNTDLVFLDPDNGLLAASVKKKQPRSVKYVFYEEVIDYIKQGYSILVYNHRSRKPEWKYFNEIDSRLRSAGLRNNAEILTITFPRFSVRDYFAISEKQEHIIKIRAAFGEMLSGKWAKTRMTQKPLTMGVTYSEYRARFKYENDFTRHYKTLPENIVRDMINLDTGNTTTKACMYSIWKES